MDDAEVLQRIHRLVEEEHQLREHATGGHPLSDEEAGRLADLEVGLDQCWDLLRQRRARREFGQDPDEATPRDPSVVERYLQ
jgi:Protein of unknown function (DUF2630)